MAYTFASSLMVSFFVVVLFVGGTSAINCYSCYSAENPDCMNEPVPDKYKVDCSDPVQAGGAGRNSSCQKILQKIDGDATTYRVTRQCSAVTRLDCIERVGTRGVRAWYCHCNNKDQCNGASQVSVAFSTLLLVAVAVALVRFDN